MENIKHKLEIALAIKKKSLLQLSREFGVSHTHVRDVARGLNKSAVIRKKIEGFIKEAQKEIPFQYPKEKLKKTA